MRTTIYEDRESVVYMPGKYYQVCFRGHDGKGDDKVLWVAADWIENKADAQLMAAAPDLLAALEWAMDQIEYDLDLDHQEQVKAAYSAIARAKVEA